MDQNPVIESEDDLPEQLRVRREKRAALIQRGVDPYPVTVPRTKTLLEIRSSYSHLEIDTTTGDLESGKYMLLILP